jgi:hypothetical protein
MGSTAGGTGQPAGRPIFEEQRGPVYIPVYVERKVKIYAIHESEVKNINLFSGIETVVASIAGGAFSFGIGTLWNVATASDKNTERMGIAVVSGCGLLIVICLAVGVWAHLKRKAELTTILGESSVNQ